MPSYPGRNRGANRRGEIPVSGTGQQQEGIPVERVCLYASFDEGPVADVSRGNPRPTINPALVRHEPTGGRFGGRLVFEAYDNGFVHDECVYESLGNFPFDPGGFEGTISIWLQGDPDHDLNDEHPVDPFHISRHPADASFYLDLTRPNDWRYGSPRKLRYGFYGDSPARDMFEGGWLLVAGELGWNDRAWHHVVATFRNVNSGNEDGSAALYLDGQLRATMDGYRHAVAWNLEEIVINLGQRYVGSIDDLLILDVALSADTVAAFYERAEPAAAWWEARGA